MKNASFFGTVLLTAGILSHGGLSLVAAADDKPLSQEQIEAIAIQPPVVQKDGTRVVPAMEPLFKEETLTFGGTTYKYRLHTPENLESGKKYPLILWLHGAGEAGDDNRLQLVHLHHILPYLVGERKRDFFLLVPQQPRDGSGGMWVGSSDSTMIIPGKLDKETRERFVKQSEEAYAPDPVTVTFTEEDELTFIIVSHENSGSPPLAMLDKVVADYPVDKDRITVSGLSSGGTQTWRALESRPELFAAAVPLVTWSALSDAALERSPILKKVPIWAIYSSDDNGIDRARGEFERVEKAGCNVKKTEFGICGHSAWTPAMLQADIFSWLLSRAKKDGEYVAVLDANVNPDEMKGIVEVATRDPSKPTLAPQVAVKPADNAKMRQVTNPSPWVKPIESTDNTKIQPVTIPSGSRWMDSFDKSRGTVTETNTTTFGGSTPRGGIDPAVQEIRDKLYNDLALAYFSKNENKITNEFRSAFFNMSKKKQIALVETLLSIHQEDLDVLQQLEDIVNSIQTRPASQAAIIVHGTVPVLNEKPQPQFVMQSGDEEITVTGKIIEDCDRPWAMTSDSLYGMFPADWADEAKGLPDFVVSLASDELAKKLAASVSGDGKDFVLACQSILALPNNPASSPWFETEGGRLRSDIRYSLSVKGQMFVRLLRTVKDSNTGDGNRGKIAQRTLEKIDTILTTK